MIQRRKQKIKDKTYDKSTMRTRQKQHIVTSEDPWVVANNTIEIPVQTKTTSWIRLTKQQTKPGPAFSEGDLLHTHVGHDNNVRLVELRYMS